ncbi:UDP-N-acetylmuramyl pentapeptide phosphotransferase [Brevibacillus composti]|uniref:UDP-N-acetylmuramyl pentapeptide phosphotransferase n=1 Tax=Brevibacillus composti TaxID=2796470 RepID=A0A7T5EHV9_9BACL|nr:UDP-N-acetylmuramyl pentapeptide phosphotransferase [Brevibacillus composti]QQE72866.1 UDP-N-acetylmuramyl pentapeptide phosphotransferase [Brevibacillus composti]QUO39944.1 UDP-N-acetylmuramyl pentapeptide phosphotransferase [Brevibacillus composti]
MEPKLMGVWVLGVAGPFLFHRCFFHRFLEKMYNAQIVRANYRGEQVVTAGGLLLAASAALVQCVLLGFGYASRWSGEVLGLGLLLLTGSLSLAVFGWVDDRSSDKQPKGFRGHVGTLLSERRLTSGMWKVLGGGGTALIISSQLQPDVPGMIVGAGLLALSSNLLNLFDVRPGRALKVFWMLVAVPAVSLIVGAAPAGLWHWLLPVITATLLLFPHDAKARLMLGDTGANYLGFVAGFALVVSLSFSWQIVVLLLFAGLHLLSEFVSFSRLIARVGWLNRLDEWGRPMEGK